MTQSIICIVIFIIALISYLINKIPMAVTSLAAMLLLVVTGCVDGSMALSSFSDTNVILMASMFVISAGMSKTKLTGKVSSALLKLSGGSFTLGLALCSILTVLAAQLIPDAVLAFCVVYPFVSAYCRKAGVNPSKAVFSIGLLSIASAGWIPIGSGASSYITENTFLMFYGGAGYEFTRFSHAIAKIPMIIALFAYVVFFASKIAPEKKETDDTTQLESTGRIRQIISTVIFIIVLLCLILVDILPVTSWQICLAGALLMLLSGILSEKEAVSSLRIPLILLYVGALTMGQALASSGVITIIGSSLSSLLGSSPNAYLLGLVFFIIPFLLTQIMVNSSLIMSFKPIVVMTCVSLGYSPIGPVILLTTGSIAAFMTPIAGPAVPLMMGTGAYNLRNQLKMSIIPAIIICITMVLWTMTVFPV